MGKRFDENAFCQIRVIEQSFEKLAPWPGNIKQMENVVWNQSQTDVSLVSGARRIAHCIAE
jgi:hypothetical protein